MTDFEDKEMRDEIKKMNSTLQAVVGFRVRVSRSEIEAHCKKRSAAHREAVVQAEEKLHGVRIKGIKGEEDDEDPDEALGFTGIRGLSSYVGDFGGDEFTRKAQKAQQKRAVVASLKHSIDHHQKMVQMFDFYAGHLAEEIFDLTPQEVALLEFVGETHQGPYAVGCF